MRDSVLFYRSFREAIKLLPEEERLKAYEMIFDYAFDDKESDENGIASAIFKLVKPQIDANNKRYENGKRPKRNISKTEAKQKQNVSKPEANVNDNVNENVNIKESVKEKPQKHKYGSYGNVRLTDAELDKLNNDYGESKTEAAIRFLDEYIAEKDYKSKSHYLAMRRWVFQAVEDRKTKKPDNRLGAFGNYKQSSTDEEWDELTALALREVNGK